MCGCNSEMLPIAYIYIYIFAPGERVSLSLSLYAFFEECENEWK